MQVTANKTYTITVDDADVSLLLPALYGLAERLQKEIDAAEVRQAQGVNVWSLDGYRDELDRTRSMISALRTAQIEGR